MTGIRGSIRLGLVVALAILATRAAAISAAEDVWRLAGTFNYWNPADDTWRLTPLPDGRFFMQVDLKPGTYGFKFVRNGTWESGHLGAAGAEGRLTQPGQNISLTVEGQDSRVPILLDPTRRRWERSVPAVSEPVAVVRVPVMPRVGVAMPIDVRGSLLPPGGGTIEAVRIEPENTTDLVITRDLDAPGDDTRRLVTPNRPGLVSFRVSIQAGGEWSQPQHIELDVMQRIFVIHPRPGASMVDLIPTDEDTWVGVVKTVGTGVKTFKLRDLARRRLLTAHARPAIDGETFALVYSIPAAKLQVIPGQFHVEQQGQGVRLVDRTKLNPNMEVLHDPRRPDHFQAISADLGLVDLTAFTHAHDGAADRLEIRMHGPDDKHSDVPMTAVASDDGIVTWRARVRSPEADRLRYDLIHNGRVVRLTGHQESGVPIDPLFETPDWAKQAVWYQIFPERFRNGNPANDPHGPWVFPLAWNSTWQIVHPGEFEAWSDRVRSAGADPNRWDRERTGEPGGRFYNVVWDRRYGGDLQGIRQQLDHLQSLGVTALYLNPVFEGESMHKYDTSDFRHVDDNFGADGAVPESWAPNPEEPLRSVAEEWVWTEADRELLRLIDDVHQRGMHIIIDGVFNHVGRNHPAFQDLQRNGRESPYADWLMGEFDEAGRLTSWVAWDQPSGWLPKFNQNPDGGLVYGVADHIMEVTRRWMDPNGDGDPSDGIDGWRLDVPLDVGDPFWHRWRRQVKAINPDAFIAAEIWTEGESHAHLRGDQFDAQMHYPFAREVINWLAMEPGMTSQELGRRLERIYDLFEPQTQLVQQNLMESHDTDRLVSNLFNARPGRQYDAGNRPQQGEPYNEGRPDEHAYALARLALILQAPYAGSPMIYYGQEVGMFGADDPSNRKTRPWPDLDPPDNDDDRADYDLEQFYTTWLRRRAGLDVLQLGMVHHLDSGDPDVFAFERRLGTQAVLVVVNRGDKAYPMARLTIDPAHADRKVGELGATIVSLLP